MTPFLYKNMVIHPQKLNEAFGATLTASHPGIPHIRTFRVYTRASRVDRRRTFGSKRISYLQRLIFAVPRDALTRFEYDGAKTLYTNGNDR
jgi:hypothetical protein